MTRRVTAGLPSIRGARLDWTGSGMRFEGGGTAPVTPPIVVDGDGREGPSPMIALLLAAAGCAGSDVVMILEKMRVRLTRLSIEVTGVRREEEPRRYVELHYHFMVGGEGLAPEQAERAVSLSLEKYCSVTHSLAPDIAVRHQVTVV